MRACVLVGTIIVLAFASALGSSPGDSDNKANRERIDVLIKQLGDDDFARREAASKELAALGKPALRALWQAASSDDLEVRRRAERVAAAIVARLPPAREVHRIEWPGVHAYSTSFSPDGRHFLAGGDGNTIRLYEVKTGKLIHELTGHEHWIGHALFTPNGKHVLSYSTDASIRLWDVATGKEVRKLAEHPTGIFSLDLTPDGKRFVVGCGDGTLRIRELATGKEVGKLTGPPGGCVSCFLLDGKQVLSGCDRTLHLWDVATARELRTFAGHTAPVYGFFLLPGGKQALSYSADQTARLWDLATGKEVKSFAVGPALSDIRGLALSPDGKRILVGGARSNEVRLIDLTSGKELHRFTLAAPARGLSFSRDGRFAASGTWRGFVYLWRMPAAYDDD